MEIVFRKLIKDDLDIFIEMRTNQLQEKGIAKELLDKVVNEAKSYSCGAVQITASDMGVLLYTDYGFKKNKNFMQYTFELKS